MSDRTANHVVKRQYRQWDEVPHIYAHNLRMLLFWASVGVRRSVGGEYANEIEGVIESHAEAIGFKLDEPAKFMSPDECSK